MTTAYVTDERFALHSMEGHPEFAGRLTAIIRYFDEVGINADLEHLEFQSAQRDAIRAVHAEKYLDRLARTSEYSGPTMFGLDTYVTPQSYEIARLAVGGVMRVVDAVMQQETDNGLAAIRPPGHHATPVTGMGFCLLNNIAIAVRHAQRAYNLQRVLIVDYDVHHGNGTQEVFYDDSRVLFISTHQSPLYPGTGAIFEAGQGAGAGYTINIPLPPGVGDGGFDDVYQNIVIPAARRFAPQLMIVSAGFDAHWADPLANLRLSLAGYAGLTRTLIELADELCDGRIVFVLEGGYNLQVLRSGWLNVANALLRRDPIDDPLGDNSGSAPDIQRVIDRAEQIHKLG